MNQHFVYSKNVIEFVTVVAETCLFLEKSNQLTKEYFVEKSVKILPLLYLKTVLINKNKIDYDDIIERFVSEEDYNYVKNQIEILLGPDDAFLDTFHPDIQYSDTPIAAFISEQLADIYQELKDFAANYHIGETDVMEGALVNCLQSFEEHWGQKLLNALRALHNIKYDDKFEQNTEEIRTNNEENIKLNRNSFFNFQTNDDDDI